MEILIDFLPCLKIFFMAVTTLSFCSLGIYSGVWWSFIRFDFSVNEDNNKEAQKLLKGVSFNWQTLVVYAFVMLLISFTIGIRCNGPLRGYEPFPAAILATLLFWIITFIASIVEINYSKNSKCDTIYKKGLELGRNKTEFLNWVSKEGYDLVKDVDKINKKQCYKPHVVFVALCATTLVLFLLFTATFIPCEQICIKEEEDSNKVNIFE